MSKFDDLELRILGLESRLAAAELRLPPAPRPAAAPIDEGCRILTGVELAAMRGSAFAMPSDEELRELHNIILARHPVLRPETSIPALEGEAFETHLRGFVASFRRVGELFRAPAITDRRDAFQWTEEAEHWARTRGLGGTIRVSAFVAGALAHGVDVRLVVDCGKPAWRRTFIAVQESAFGGEPIGDRWRMVLT